MERYGLEWRKFLRSGVWVPLAAAMLLGCGGGGVNNTPPIANAGPDQNVTTGTVVTLDGGGCTDADGDLLTHRWSIASKPSGSAAVLSDPSAVRATFAADRDGVYVVSLIVNDGQVDSAPDIVSITASSANSAPVANAGPDQNVTTGSIVTLDGSASSDANGDPLTYLWAFTSRPAGSAAALSSATSGRPTFTADRDGVYVVSLIVNDGQTDGVADTVTITASSSNSAPVANAGPDQNLNVGDVVLLKGWLSSDADGDILTYKWSFASKPAGSTAELPNPGGEWATFTADREGTYVVSLIVNDGLVDSAPDTVTVTASARAGNWGTPTFIWQHASDQIAMDPNGNVILVADAWDSIQRRNDVVAIRYTPAGGWGVKTPLENTSNDAFYSRVGMDGSGGAMAVWCQQDGDLRNAYANRYDPGTNWGTASLIEYATDRDDILALRMAMNIHGDALIIGIRHTEDVYGIMGRIVATHYSPATGWGTADLIDSGLGLSSDPQVAIDSNGNATAVWAQWNADRTESGNYANRYTPGRGWGIPTRIDGASGSVGGPVVAMDDSGTAIAAWAKWDGARMTMWANRYEPETGWGTATPIATAWGDWMTGVSLDVAMDGSGDAIAVWSWWERESHLVYANRYTPGIGWGAEIHLQTGAGGAEYPEVAMDSSGTAIAIWRGFELGTARLYASRYAPGTGWGLVTLVDNGLGFPQGYRVVMDGRGNAMVVWNVAWSDGSWAIQYENR